jgi:LmbE family N-acetylglucosaminyl deacetylase
MDVYIQPHSDDICFSLGGFAHSRQTGCLLTVFPISGYVPVPAGVARPSADWVTRTRIAEDRAFAQACGLRLRMLRMPCASLLGYGPFDLGRVDENLGRVETALVQAALALAVAPGGRQRPWLFCPSGIGGHVDHVTIRMAVTRNYGPLAHRYRIGFYEDLHYASNGESRRSGIDALLQAMPDRALHRLSFPLGAAEATKLALIRHYRSQFLHLPSAIGRFTPALEAPAAPHEAVWTEALPAEG